ncbi:MAG: hypothetical protein EBX40_07500 [Gammaproteobacteria bacterium]|nr:hypothetical protein [Gammaproteobacteria bacterium]
MFFYLTETNGTKAYVNASFVQMVVKPEGHDPVLIMADGKTLTNWKEPYEEITMKIHIATDEGSV